MSSYLHDIKSGIKLSKNYFLQSVTSAKILLIMIIETAFIITVYKNVGVWLRYTDNKIGVFELFPYSFMQDIPFLVIIIGIIIMVGDLPVISERTRYEVIRMNKRTYLYGQFFYCVWMTVSYYAYIWLVIVLVAFPKISFTNKWSYFMKTATKGTGFLNNNIELLFPVELMNKYTPFTAFALAMILAILFGVFTGNLVMLLNQRFRHLNIATSVCMAFVVLDVLYSKIRVGLFKYIYYISPISMMKSYAYSTINSVILYAGLFLLLGTIILFMANLEVIKKNGVES